MMKKKDKELDRVSMFYDAEHLIVFLVCLVGYLGMLLFVLIDKTDQKELTFSGGRAITSAKLMTPFVLVLVLSFLRRRVIDSKGISSTYLGLRYSHISWQGLHHYTIEKVWPEFQKKSKNPTRWRAMLVFKEKPIKYGKSTTIMIPATKEARALAEKYFGPPAYVQEGVSVEEEK